MRYFGALLAGLMGLATMAGAELASAGQPQRNIVPIATTPTPILDEVKPPIGWIDFCRSGHDSDCRDGDKTPTVITVTSSTWSDIVRVNRYVNNTIEQVEDLAQYGRQEFWTYPDSGKGDCEDIALLKRRILIREGFPRQALLMTVVRDETGAGHAVITIVTDRGDYVLDSKTSQILPWSATGYGFVKRQSQVNANVWVKLGEPASPGLIVAGH